MLKYYCNLDESTGKPISAIVVEEGTDPPPEYPVEMTEEAFNLLARAVLIDGVWSLEPEGPPVEPLETRDQKIARLETEKAALQEQLQQLNGDLAGFIDFYFQMNPTQA